MKIKLLILNLAISQVILAQISNNSGIYFDAKAFSKEISLYRGKYFVLNDVLGISDSVIEFNIDPLAATSSGEITSLVYKCPQKNKEGLILGFYGDRWNDAGVIFQAYAYKNLPKKTALEILNKIENLMDEHAGYLRTDLDNNNIYFRYDDMTFLIYMATSGVCSIRIFWNSFDAEWQNIAFKRTKKRLLNKLEDTEK